MSAILTPWYVRVVQLIGGVRACVYLAVAVVLLVLLLMARSSLKDERQALETCTTNVALFDMTQGSNLATIEDLEKRLAANVEARRMEMEASSKVIAAVDAESARLDQERDKLELQLIALYKRDAGAQAWGDTGVDAGVAANLPGAKR